MKKKKITKKKNYKKITQKLKNIKLETKYSHNNIFTRCGYSVYEI